MRAEVDQETVHIPVKKQSETWTSGMPGLVTSKKELPQLNC